jgi:hypothetical protein
MTTIATFPDLSIKVGDRVRSHDFPERRFNLRPPCYVEGTVVGLKYMYGYERYEIKVDKVVWEGIEDPKDERLGHSVFPLLNGVQTREGQSNGVEKL